MERALLNHIIYVHVCGCGMPKIFCRCLSNCEIRQTFLLQKFPATLSHPSLAPTLSPFHPHLIHDHLLGPSASLASFNDGLQELEVLDVPALLYAVNEVLDLRLCHFTAQVGIVPEDLSQCVRFNKLYVYACTCNYVHV